MEWKREAGRTRTVGTRNSLPYHRAAGVRMVNDMSSSNPVWIQIIIIFRNTFYNLSGELILYSDVGTHFFYFIVYASGLF